MGAQKQRIIDLQKQVRIGREALQRIVDEVRQYRDAIPIAEDALEKLDRLGGHS